MEYFILTMVIIAAIVGPSISVASIGYSTIRALARNPSSSPVILMGMLMVLIFNEGIVIISLLVFYEIFKPR
jgi:F0F1-type ATP synthase membrane subunit c/vacuolar-type H+-ATPase subunit K